jgi:hypothetical protein
MEKVVNTVTYRELLSERSSKGFSEPEIVHILNQVLPLLVKQHDQHQMHGQLSLEVLLLKDGTVVSLSPSTIREKGNIRQDLTDLGLCMIELLTGISPDQLQDSSGIWQWENQCFVSDELIQLLNAMLGQKNHDQFRSAQEVLATLNRSSSAAPPEPISLLNTPSYRQPEGSPSTGFISPQSPWKPWQLGLISLGSMLGVIVVGLGVWKTREPGAAIFSYFTGNQVTRNEPANIMLPIQQDKKIGYIDAKGNLLIKASADLQFTIDQQNANIDADGKCNAVSRQNFRLPPKLTKTGLPTEELIVLELGGKCGYINRKGQVAITPKFEDAAYFSEGLAAVKIGEKYGFINSSGQVVISPQFAQAQPFAESLAPVIVGNKYGYIDKSGKLVINPQFDWAGPFVNGVSAVMVDQFYGYIDKTGKQVVPPQFSYLSYLSDDLAPIKRGEMWGYVNKAGEIAIEPQFHSADAFSEGLAVACPGEGNCGYIDKTGKFVINPQFQAAWFLSEGLAAVSIGNQWGYIDQQGKFAINPQFTWAGDFSNGVALVQVADKWGYIDRNGSFIWQPSG